MDTDSGEQGPVGLRRARLRRAAEARGIPLPTILVTIAVVALAYLAAKVVYHLREIILLLVVAGFVALLLNPLVVALKRVGIRRRGVAVAIVTLLGLAVFVGLAAAFGYPLVNGVTHLADSLPSYVRDAEHGRGWIGRLVRRYHVQKWVQSNAPRLINVGQGLAKPALSLGKGAFSLLLALLTIFVLVLLLLLEGTKMKDGLLGLMAPSRADRYSRIAREVSQSVSGYMLGNFLTSLIAGVVVLVTLLALGVPFPFLWALWVALVDFLPMIGGALAGIPVVLFAVGHSLHGRHHHAGGVPHLHAGREPRAEPGHHEPDGQGEPAAGAGVDPGRRLDRQLDRGHLRRVRGGAAGHPERGRDPGADPRGLAGHGGPGADRADGPGPGGRDRPGRRRRCVRRHYRRRR